MKVEEKLNSLPLLRFSKSNSKVKDLADILYKLIVLGYQTFDTKGIQCLGNRKRSTNDAYRVCKTYIPEITYDEVKDAMKALRKQHRHSYMVIDSDYCCTVGKVVHSPRSYNTTYDHIRKKLEENAVDVKKATAFDSLANLVKEINSIDTHYEMSDSSKIYEKENEKVQNLKKLVYALPTKDITTLKNKLSKAGKTNFERYLANKTNS